MPETTENTFHSLPDDLKTEFFTSVKEAMDELEQCFSVLDHEYQPEIVHQMFRSIHTIKGNCHLVFLDDIADVCHRLEDIVSQIRSAEYSYTPICGEFITVVFQRLEQLVRALIKREPIDSAAIEVLQRAVEQVYRADFSQREAVITKTLHSLSGVLSASEQTSRLILKRLQEQEEGPLFDDMAFMRNLSDILRNKSLRHYCDIERLLKLALLLAQREKVNVDQSQLTAAVYMNLLGSKFVTSPIFDILPESEQWEKQRVSEQLALSAGFLRLSNNWQDAARMIEHSYARFDGKGVPDGLAGKAIHPGGMILSLLRFYQQQFRNAAVENKKKSAVGKALRVINSEKGYRFDPDFVDLFSRLAKEQPELLFI